MFCHKTRNGSVTTIARNEGETIPVFITAPYRELANGVLKPDVPDRCPSNLDGNELCRIRYHHWRHRSAGPDSRLLVVRCHTHGRAFTIYPPGRVPYSRTTVVLLSPEGQLPAAESPSDAAEPGSDELLEAASDAAHGTFWPDSEASGPCRRTQGRRLETAELAAGLGAGSGQAARILGVPELTLRDRAKERAAGWKARGAAVLAVLTSVIVQPQGWQRVLACGAAAGVWGEPLLWDSARSQLESLTFRFGGTEEADRGAPAPRGVNEFARCKPG